MGSWPVASQSSCTSEDWYASILCFALIDWMCLNSRNSFEELDSCFVTAPEITEIYKYQVSESQGEAKVYQIGPGERFPIGVRIRVVGYD